MRLAGSWRIQASLPAVEAVDGPLGAGMDEVGFDSTGLGAWDSGLVTCLTGIIDRCNSRGIEVDQ